MPDGLYVELFFTVLCVLCMAGLVFFLKHSLDRYSIRPAHPVSLRKNLFVLSPRFRCTPALSVSCWVISRSALSAALFAFSSMAAMPVFAQTDEIEYVYDKTGRLVQTITPTGASVQFIYDAVGNIVSNTRSGDAAGNVTITGFTPQSGPVGTAVTITGTGFNPTAANNTVKFNGTATAVSAASATSLQVAVPAAATTGAISVANSGGTAISTTPFTVEDSSGGPGGNPVVVNLAAGASTSFTFPGTVGQGYVIGITGFVAEMLAGDMNVTVSTPGNTTLTTCRLPWENNCVLPYLPATGDYKVTLTAGTYAVSFSYQLSADLADVLVADTFKATTIDKVGQAATYTFEGTTGMKGVVSFSNVSIPGGGTIQLYSPDGALLKTDYVNVSPGSLGSGQLAFNSLPANGPYKVRLIPPLNGATGSLAVQITKAITVGGEPRAMSLSAGQLISYAFTGTAQQRLGIGLADLVRTPVDGELSVIINRPGGLRLGNFYINGPAAAASYDLPILPDTGDYTILIASTSTSASFNLLVTADVAGTLTDGGPARTFSSTRAGQAASYTFAATAGENISLALANSTFPGVTYLRLYKPDNTQLDWGSVQYSGSGPGKSGQLTKINLPVGGTYMVRVVPTDGAVGTASVSLKKGGTAAPDAAPQAVNLLTAQNGIFTFTGTAGQRLSLGLANLATTPPGGSVLVYIYGPPYGNSLGSFMAGGAAGGATYNSLPETGTYRIEAYPTDYATAYAATFDLLITTDATGTLPANGAPLTFSPTRVGQGATYTFAATAGENVNLALTGDTFMGTTVVEVRKPNSYYWQTLNVPYNGGAAASASLSLPNLPDTGNYTVRIRPPNGGLGTIKVSVSR